MSNLFAIVCAVLFIALPNDTEATRGNSFVRSSLEVMRRVSRVLTNAQEEDKYCAFNVHYGGVEGRARRHWNSALFGVPIFFTLETNGEMGFVLTNEEALSPSMCAVGAFKALSARSLQGQHTSSNSATGRHEFHFARELSNASVNTKLSTERTYQLHLGPHGSCSFLTHFQGNDYGPILFACAAGICREDALFFLEKDFFGEKPNTIAQLPTAFSVVLSVDGKRRTFDSLFSVVRDYCTPSASIRFIDQVHYSVEKKLNPKMRMEDVPKFTLVNDGRAYALELAGGGGNAEDALSPNGVGLDTIAEHSGEGQ